MICVHIHFDYNRIFKGTRWIGSNCFNRFLVEAAALLLDTSYD